MIDDETLSISVRDGEMVHDLAWEHDGSPVLLEIVVRPKANGCVVTVVRKFRGRMSRREVEI